MTIKHLICIMATLVLVSSAVAAKKDAKKPVAPVKGAPIIEISLSSRFERYLKIREALDKKMADLADEKDQKKRDAEMKVLKAEEKDLLDDVSDRISKENKKFTRQIQSLDKKLDDLDKQLEKAGDNEAQYDKIMVQLEKAQQELGSLNRVSSAYDMFRIACNSNKKGLENTPLGLIGSMAPPIKGETFAPEPKPISLDQIQADYKIIIFFSMNNRESLQGLREAISLSGKKTSGKEAAIIAINVDKNKSDVAAAKNELAKSAARCTPIHDADWTLCGAYKVGFLPQAVLLDNSDAVVDVIVGGGVRKGIQDAIKEHHRNNKGH